MITRASTTDKYSIHLDVCIDDSKGFLWIEVVTYDQEKQRTVQGFAGNEYGKALNYYTRQQLELKSRYGQ